MKKSETVQIITLLAGNYESIANKSQVQREMMLNTWQECLGDLDYNIVLQAVKKSMIESAYPPTIHEIRKNAIEIINPTTTKTAIEAWNEAYKMICNASRLTAEDFEKASPEVKKFFGDIRQVVELGRTDIETVNTVTKGQFLKQYDILIERTREQKLLPQQMSEFIKQINSNVNIKQIGERYE